MPLTIVLLGIYEFVSRCTEFHEYPSLAIIPNVEVNEWLRLLHPFMKYRVRT